MKPLSHPSTAQTKDSNKFIRKIIGAANCTALFFLFFASFALGNSAVVDIQTDTESSRNSLRPNFLLIVADDMGYSDAGAYGGEIDTPNLNLLAKNGTRLTDFHVAPTCSPTRAMLLTGNDSHVAGLGSMAEALRPEQRGKPGYEGYLNHSVATVAERLQSAGYYTAMAGKWHLGGRPAKTPAARGFEQSFALINGAANYWGRDQDEPWSGTLFEAIYFENDQRTRLPAGAYTTNYFTKRLIEFLKEDDFGRDKPFFAYLAFNAPHTPLQAPSEMVAKYRGYYDKGPAALRERRLQQQAKLKLFETNIKPHSLIDVPAWEDLSIDSRNSSSRRMEIYAAMVDLLDKNIGKVIQALNESGQLKNTFVIFLSDNGAEGTDENVWLEFLEHIGLPPKLANSIRSSNQEIREVGSPESYAAYGPGWAQASMAPFSLTKGFTTEGGIRAPMIIYGPGIAGGQINHSFSHVTDIVPTILDFAGIGVNAVVNGHAVHLPQGESLKSRLLGQPSVHPSAPRSTGWEFLGRRAFRFGPWKAVYMNQPNVKTGSGYGPAKWLLYNLNKDPGETVDLSTEQPMILKYLTSRWDTYADKNGVVLVSPEEYRTTKRHEGKPPGAR